MRTKPLLASTSAALLLTAALAGCSSPAGSGSGADASMSPMPTMSASEAAMMSVTGTFAGENGKNVAGTVTISGDTITLSDFSSDEGPDLHLYLAKGTSEADVTAGTEIAGVEWDAASQTFTLPAGVDAADYTYLVVHCDKALAVFGAAPLSS